MAEWHNVVRSAIKRHITDNSGIQEELMSEVISKISTTGKMTEQIIIEADHILRDASATRCLTINTLS